MAVTAGIAKILKLTGPQTTWNRVPPTELAAQFFHAQDTAVRFQETEETTQDLQFLPFWKNWSNASRLRSSLCSNVVDGPVEGRPAS